MKPIKGINQTNHPIDQPKDTIFYGKNGILNEKIGSHINEPGFKLSNANIPHTIIGIIELPNELVVFSTDNINSVIGIYNQETDTYEIKLNRIDLGFNTNYPIKGVYKKDFKDNIIIVFTDNFNTPKYINLGNINSLTDSVNDYLLFPNSKYPIYNKIKVSNFGGQIKSGTKYFVIRYKNNDGTITNFFNISQPIIVVTDSFQSFIENSGNYAGSESNLTTSKSINIQFSNLDINYDELQVGIIEKTNSIISTTVKIIAKIKINNITTNSFNYLGIENIEESTLDDVLINKLNYNRVGTFGVLDDTLYAADLSSNSNINYQKYANIIRIQYVTRSVNIFKTTGFNGINFPYDYPSQRLESIKGFQHGEVYAFYISLILNDGTETNAFHIPGRHHEAGDKLDSIYKHGVESTGTFPDGTDVKNFK